VTSLAATLWSLRQLGYRSRSRGVENGFTRIGTVHRPNSEAHRGTWTSHSGQTMQANAGDLAGPGRSADLVGTAKIYSEPAMSMSMATNGRRRGDVFARAGAAERNNQKPSKGPTTAADGDWVVRGADGEEWPGSRPGVLPSVYTELGPAADANGATPGPD